jgi:hypothetical protein
MVAMIKCPCLSLKAAPIAASMAIDRPQAIDVAPFTAAASAEDGSRTTILLCDAKRRMRGGK